MTSIGRFAIENAVDLVLVGPEEPLVKGIHDFFLADEKLKSIPVIGPQEEGAQLEGQQGFFKGFYVQEPYPHRCIQNLYPRNLA